MLKIDYKVSCQELDFLDEESRHYEGVMGARMTVGGFGGCTSNLVRKDSIEKYSTYLTKMFSEKFGIDPEFYQVKLANGVELLN